MARFFVSVIFIGLFNLFIDLKINLYDPKPELTVLLIIVVSKTNRLNEEVAVIWSQTLKYCSVVIPQALAFIDLLAMPCIFNYTQ